MGLHIVIWISLLLCVGCQSSSLSSKVNVSQLSSELPQWGLEYTSVGQGLMAIDVQLDEQIVPMFLDTGATQSAVFDNKLRSLMLTTKAQQEIAIHGLSGRESRPFTWAKNIAFGPLVVANARLAILPARNYEATPGQKEPAGLIGMDLLSEYQLYHDYKNSRIYFLPADLDIKYDQESWSYMPLRPSLSDNEDRGLHFLTLKAGVFSVPAMIDTGSEFNVINWSASKVFADFIVLRHRLLDAWTLQGANGEFKPEGQANIKNISGGEKFWPSLPFYIRDLDGLKILGVRDEPFIIMGQPFLKDTTYVLDFPRNAMWIKLDQDEIKSDKYITHEFRATRIKRMSDQ